MTTWGHQTVPFLGSVQRHAWIAAVILVAQSLTPSARANLTVKAVAEGEKTDSGFVGTAPANTLITINVPNNGAHNPPPFTTYTTRSDAAGNWMFKIPKADFPKLAKGGDVNVTAPGCPVASTKLAAVFTPGQDVVVTALTVSPGSTATAAGMSFALSGGFTAVDTAVDYDPASPTFGTLTSQLLASQFHLTGTSGFGTLDLLLDTDQPFSVDLLPAWQSPNLSGNTISFSDIPMSGTATFNSSSSPFRGTADGTVTFLDNDMEVTAFQFNVATDFGDVSGSVSAEGISQLSAVPEPPTAVLSLLGTASLLAATVLRRRAGGRGKAGAASVPRGDRAERTTP